jgi:hypothetical protein
MKVGMGINGMIVGKKRNRYLSIYFILQIILKKNVIFDYIYLLVASFRNNEETRIY